MRAFLSHSSVDKPYVTLVAKQLGRQYCVFDTYSFDTGEDFREAIRSGLDKSSVFVLFGSIKSLESVWVKFEQDEAELRTIKGGMKNALVFLLGEDIDHTALPEWLTRGRVVPASSPKSVARQIHRHLQDIIREQQQPFFVGRRSELGQAEELLLSYNGEEPRRYIAIHGLSGIGRRTLISRIAHDMLNLPQIVVFKVEEGDGIHDLAAKIAEQTEVYSNMAELRLIVQKIQSLPEADAVKKINIDLQQIVANRELPVFFDFGGLLDNDGYLTSAIQTIVDSSNDFPDIYLALIASRKLRSDTRTHQNLIPTVRVEPLSIVEIVRLLGVLAKRHDLPVTPSQLNDLATYVRGYPPAAHYAIELAREYGVDATVENKYPLVEFRVSHFIAYLSREGILNDPQHKVLSLLSYYSPLPLSVIGKIVDLNTEELSSTLTLLIDTCIVIPDLNGLYALSDPITEAAQRIVDRTKIPHSEIALALEEYIKNDIEQHHLLPLGRSLFRARRLSGGLSESDQEIHLVSDMIALVAELYHSRDYEKSIEFGLASLESRPDSIETRGYVIRSYAQLGGFTEADEHLAVLHDRGKLREAYFLKGFVARLQGRLEEAITAYEESLKRGRRGLAVHRELASCYHLVEKYDQAAKHIEKAESISPDNRYVIDLKIIIAIHQKNEVSARRGLHLLEAMDRKEFYLHRLSTVEMAFGDPEDAFKAAQSALAQTNRPTFAMLAQAAKTAISCYNLDAASKWIFELDKRFHGVKSDIRIGLHCRWEIASGEYQNALSYHNQLQDTESITHKVLRRDILQGLLSADYLDNLIDEKSYHDELEQLEKELKGVQAQDITDLFE